jgi:tRNA pseudouridine55 synthase
MDGVLLIDKPSGPTSHDVVARLRHTSGERGIGHTGTLDPLATGLLPLVLGRATRLASFLASGAKTYDAVIQLGVATETDDAMGAPLGARAGVLPDAAAVAAALDGFRGTFAQVPPRHSAKRVGGEKAYDLARQDRPMELKPVDVTVQELELLDHTDDRVTVRLTATAGFYVRALARDLGERLGCGAHLTSLRRTRSGIFQLRDATPLEVAERLGKQIAQRLISPAEALCEFPSVELTPAGLTRATHGNWLSPEHLARALADPLPAAAAARAKAGQLIVRVLAPLSAGGRLVALAEPRDGALHPVVVLG